MNTIGYAIAACGVALALIGAGMLWRNRWMQEEMQKLCEKNLSFRENGDRLNQLLGKRSAERDEALQMEKAAANRAAAAHQKAESLKEYNEELEGQLGAGVRQLQQTMRERDHAVLQAKASRVSRFCGAYDQATGSCTKGMRTYPTKDGTKKCSANCPEFVWAGLEGDSDDAE